MVKPETSKAKMWQWIIQRKNGSYYLSPTFSENRFEASYHTLDATEQVIERADWTEIEIRPKLEEKTSVNIDIVTKVKGAFKIEQEVFSNQKKLFNATLDTSEKHIRDALIELGWTPPEGDDV